MLVSLVVGSDTDLPMLELAVGVLEEFKVPYEVQVISAHRTPARAAEFAQQAASRGVSVIIAAAGGAAHLPGALAAGTLVPVIGVPLSTSALGGQDALYSMVQMPAGVPVATVGVDAAKNGALLAVHILATRSARLRKRLARFRAKMAKQVEARSAEVSAKVGARAGDRKAR